MKLALVTDAWQPQVNGVVTTLVELVREMQGLGHEVVVIHPGCFDTRPCPGYAGIDLAVRPARSLAHQLDALAPDAIHLATEGPLGWAARRLLPRDELAQVYGCADVFVMPSRHETFGLVMLEAMASGTPVAAYPVEGPLEVVGNPGAGGVLHHDLSVAWYRALVIPRHEARTRAQRFGWAYAAQLFASHLVAARRGPVGPALLVHANVTKMSSESSTI